MKQAFVLLLALLVMAFAGCSTQPAATEPQPTAATEAPTTPKPTEPAPTEVTTPETEPSEAPTEVTEATEATEEPTQPEETQPSVHTHSYSKATCTKPAKCSCGKTNGSALGHSWQDATCQAPKTCTRCSATEGDALPHSYVDGTCSVCGDSQYADISLIEGKEYHAWVVQNWEHENDESGEIITYKYINSFHLYYSSLSSDFTENYEEGDNTAYRDAAGYMPLIKLYGSATVSSPASFIYEGEYYWQISGGDGPSIKSEILNNRLVVPDVGEFALQKDGYLVLTEYTGPYSEGSSCHLPVGTLFSTDWADCPPGATPLVYPDLEEEPPAEE